MTLPHKDLREFLVEAEKQEELVRIKTEVHWNLEAGAIARRLCELGQGKSVKKGGTPAVLFEKITGYSPGYRIAANTHASVKRVAMMLGHKKPEEATYFELQDLYIRGVENPVKPVVVKNGPCKENKLTGKDVNLYKFPAPMVHDGDGGRYMCTWHFVITKDPETNWMNWGMYRAMVLDTRTLAGMMEPLRHISMMLRKYEAEDKPMPFAIAIGPDAICALTSVSPVPFGVAEADIAGGLGKRPVELVKCETNDLLVPANAEIVIEGIVPPKKRAYEGPFGEYTGYRASPRDLRPIYMVHAITYRNDPILTMSVMGVPVDDCDITGSIFLSAMIRKRLLEVGLPIIAVHMPPEAACNLLVVSTKTPSAGIAHSIRDVAFTTVLEQRFKKILVVNDDVDITNVNEVLHAFATRVHPVRGQHVSYEPSHPLFPFASLEERLDRTAPGCLYDGTWPTNWHPFVAVPPKSSFKTIYNKEIQETVVKRWEEYGLDHY